MSFPTFLAEEWLCVAADWFFGASGVLSDNSPACAQPVNACIFLESRFSGFGPQWLLTGCDGFHAFINLRRDQRPSREINLAIDNRDYRV